MCPLSNELLKHRLQIFLVVYEHAWFRAAVSEQQCPDTKSERDCVFWQNYTLIKAHNKGVVFLVHTMYFSKFVIHDGFFLIALHIFHTRYFTCRRERLQDCILLLLWSIWGMALEWKAIGMLAILHYGLMWFSLLETKGPVLNGIVYTSNATICLVYSCRVLILLIILRQCQHWSTCFCARSCSTG